MRYAVWIDCYRCDGQIEVEIEAEPGEAPVTSGPPSAWHPGSPPDVWIIGDGDRFGCECDDLDWDQLEEHNRERLLEHADDAMRAAEDAYWETKIQERKLEKGGF